MKPKVKPASIPATDVPEQRLQHNGEVFSTTLAEVKVHGGWLEERGREGGREDNSKLGWLLLGFLLGCTLVWPRSFGRSMLMEMANRILKLG